MKNTIFAIVCNKFIDFWIGARRALKLPTTCSKKISSFSWILFNSFKFYSEPIVVGDTIVVTW